MAPDIKDVTATTFTVLLVILMCSCGAEPQGGEEPGVSGEAAQSAAEEEEIPVTEGDDSASPCDYMGQTPPGDEPVMFAEGIVSTSAGEFRFIVSPDGKEFFFNRNASIYYMRKLENGEGWSDPAPAPFSGQFIDGESSLAHDGSSIYFCSRRPLPGAKQALNVWVSHRSEDGWGKAEVLGSPVNDQTVHTPSIASSGSIYASGLIRLRFADGAYLPAEKLTPDIKGAHPFVAPDESYILFDRRPAGGNVSDIFITYSLADGTWSEPVNLGEPINTQTKETNPTVSPDGKYIFFARNADIYWVSSAIIDRLRPR